MSDSLRTSAFVAVRPLTPSAVRLARLASGNATLKVDGLDATVVAVEKRSPRRVATGVLATGYDVSVRVPAKLEGEASGNYWGAAVQKAVHEYVHPGKK
jgi:hypothetical protein